MNPVLFYKTALCIAALFFTHAIQNMQPKRKLEIEQSSEYKIMRLWREDNKNEYISAMDYNLHMNTLAFGLTLQHPKENNSIESESSIQLLNLETNQLKTAIGGINTCEQLKLIDNEKIAAIVHCLKLGIFNYIKNTKKIISPLAFYFSNDKYGNKIVSRLEREKGMFCYDSQRESRTDIRYQDFSSAAYISPDGKKIATDSLNMIAIYHLDSGKCQKIEEKDLSFVDEFAWNYTSELLAAYYLCGKCRIWNIKTGHLIQDIQIDSDEIRHCDNVQLEWAPNKNIFALMVISSDQNQYIHFFHSTDGFSSSLKFLFGENQEDAYGTKTYYKIMKWKDDTRLLLSFNNKATIVERKVPKEVEQYLDSEQTFQHCLEKLRLNNRFLDILFCSHQN